jgi:hypothetical protein
MFTQSLDILTAFSLAEIPVLRHFNDDRNCPAEEVAGVDRLEEDRAVGVDHLEEDRAVGVDHPQPFLEVEAYLQLALVEEPRMHSAAAVRRKHWVEGHRMRLAGGLAEEEEV